MTLWTASIIGGRLAAFEGFLLRVISIPVASLSPSPSTSHWSRHGDIKNGHAQRLCVSVGKAHAGTQDGYLPRYADTWA